MNIKSVFLTIFLTICVLTTFNALASDLGYRGVRAAYRSAAEAYPAYVDMTPVDSDSVSSDAGPPPGYNEPPPSYGPPPGYGPPSGVSTSYPPNKSKDFTVPGPISVTTIVPETAAPLATSVIRVNDCKSSGWCYITINPDGTREERQNPITDISYPPKGMPVTFVNSNKPSNVGTVITESEFRQEMKSTRLIIVNPAR